MPINREDFVAQIAKKIEDEELSVFLGAGVSKEFGIPTWKEIMKPIADKLHLDIEKQSDYYLLAQYFVNAYGKPELKRYISNSTLSFKMENVVLEQLIRFRLKTIWTTNFDNSIERLLQKNLIRYHTVNNDHALVNISTNEATIVYKLNGDCYDLDNIVIAMEDWEAYAETHPGMITFLKKELVSNTFLFYGYSFQDNLVKSMLSQIQRFVGNSVGMHYSIQKRQESREFDYLIDDLERRYHVKTLLVDSYDEVAHILKEIAYNVSRHNIFISGRLGGSIDPQTEDQACVLGKELSIALLSSGYNICTGMGRKIGYFIAGPSIQYLLENGYNHIERRIKIRPFDDSMDMERRSNYREGLIETNSTVIFLYGHSSQNLRSLGMWEEYQIAKAKRKYIIPLGATGHESYRIWQDVKNNLTSYPYLEFSIDELGLETDPKKLSRIVLSILNLIVQ